MLARCFDRMLPPIDFEGLKNNINAAIDRKIKEQAEAEKIDRTVTQVPGNAIYIEEEKAYLNLPPPVELPDNTDAIYSVPEGLVGQIAQFIYAQAPLPVPEIALAGAIGLMSGIVGKAYNISNTGCNQYTLLISPTGSGKEAIASGLSKIMRAVKKIVPNSNEFIGPAEISSPQALIKVLADTPSIYSVVGEFGLALKAMSAENAAPAQMGLRRMLLDIYNKSGAENEVQRTVYSDKDKNTQAVRAPSFSLIGESTPERFYAYLSEEMISEGLLPRFNIIENMSPPAEFNEGAALVKPSEQLVRSVATLAANALNLIRQNQVINVQETDEASIILKNFRDLARHKTIQAVEDARKHLWNRAHVKALKLAAVVAIGNNFFNPVITATDAQWAIKIVQRGVEVLLARFESGDVGLSTDENKQLACIGDKIKAYLLSPYSKLEKVIGKGYGEAAITLHSERIIPYSYLQHSCSCMKVFKSDKLGATTAIKRALKTLVERGDISEVPRAELSKITKSKSICYMVELPKSFGL
jgi:hypothetical protein